MMHVRTVSRRSLSIPKNTLRALLLVGLLAATGLHAQNRAGEIAQDFTLPVWAEPEADPIRLYDLEGSIIVLDFFAYWCGPCQSSTPDLEQNVAHYYETRGGTPEGIPVVVLPINIERNNPSSTNSFIANYGLSDTTVLDGATSRAVYNRFRLNGIPLFAIINGVANSPTHQQWEIIHHHAGYHGSSYFRSRIETVEVASVDPSAPPAILSDSEEETIVEVGESVMFQATAVGAGPLSYQWVGPNGDLPGETGSTLAIDPVGTQHAGAYHLRVSNTNGSVLSEARKVVVLMPSLPTRTRGYIQSNGLAIPDGGVTTSVINVPDDFAVGDVTVTLNISHTYRGDLLITLASPSGTETTVYTGDVNDGTDHLSGSYALGSIATSSSGSWSLRIQDRWTPDSGMLNHWSLSLEETVTFHSWASTQPVTDKSEASDEDRDGWRLVDEFALRGRCDGFDRVQPVELYEEGGVWKVRVKRNREAAGLQYLLFASTDHMETWTSLEILQVPVLGFGSLESTEWEWLEATLPANAPNALVKLDIQDYGDR